MSENIGVLDAVTSKSTLYRVLKYLTAVVLIGESGLFLAVIFDLPIGFNILSWPAYPALVVTSVLLTLTYVASCAAGVLRQKRLSAFLFLIPLGCMAIETWRLVQQQGAVQALEDRGERILFDYQVQEDTFARIYQAKPPGPEWLRQWLGDRFFGNVVFARISDVKNFPFTKDFPRLANLYLQGRTFTDSFLPELHCFRNLTFLEFVDSSITDSGIALLTEFPQLRKLQLVHAAITDDSLKSISKMPHLISLGLSRVAITDAGLKELESFQQLEYLSLRDNNLTDAGITHLAGLINLRNLNLYNTHVGDAGVQSLKNMISMEKLNLENTKITDVGASVFAHFPQLKLLGLDNTQISDAGLVYIKDLRLLHDLYLDGTRVTDIGLNQLVGLPKLRVVTLLRTNVTKSGVAKARESFGRPIGIEVEPEKLSPPSE